MKYDSSVESTMRKQTPLERFRSMMHRASARQRQKSAQQTLSSTHIDPSVKTNNDWHPQASRDTNLLTNENAIHDTRPKMEKNKSNHNDSTPASELCTVYEVWKRTRCVQNPNQWYPYCTRIYSCDTLDKVAEYIHTFGDPQCQYKILKVVKQNHRVKHKNEIQRWTFVPSSSDSSLMQKDGGMSSSSNQDKSPVNEQDRTDDPFGTPEKKNAKLDLFSTSMDLLIQDSTTSCDRVEKKEYTETHSLQKTGWICKQCSLFRKPSQ